MEPILSVVVGILFAIAVYLLMSRSVVRILLGVFTLGNAANLLIFTAGRLTREVPPLVPEGMYVPPIEPAIANPLPQALILTAIVISFALTVFILILAYRAYESLGTVDTHDMREAEPRTAGEADVQ